MPWMQGELTCSAKLGEGTHGGGVNRNYSR